MKSKLHPFLSLLVVAALLLSAVAMDPDQKVWHQGFEANNWAIPGTNNFQFNCTLRQNGTSSWSGAPATSGSVFITFPESYGPGNTPLMTASIFGSNPVITTALAPVWSGFTLHWKSTVPITYLTFFWQSEGICAEESLAAEGG